MYTSRSAVESYQSCPRYRYNQYYLHGKGIVSKSQSVPLVTGSTIHRGIEHMLNRVRIGEVPDIEIAIQLTIAEYNEWCRQEGFTFTGKGTDTERGQYYIYEEQKALIEGLLRAWEIVELPNLVERFEVIAVERDIEPIEIGEVKFQAKVDAELRDKVTKDYFNYSIKSMKSWDVRSENSYKSDLQGITETWVIEEDSKRFQRRLQDQIFTFKMMQEQKLLRDKNCQLIIEYLIKQQQPVKSVSGVRFCILIKGVRKISDFTKDFVTYNPLIRGFKYQTPTGTNYAHSWRFPNSANKSGFSTLGSGWVGFSVWEEMGVKEWIRMIKDGEVQPECPNPILDSIIVPLEYFRNEGEINLAMNEVIAQEMKIARAINMLTPDCGDIASNVEVAKIMASVFPHYKSTCYWHYGEVCQYLPVCWQPEIQGNEIASGLYQIREAHHKYEREDS